MSDHELEGRTAHECFELSRIALDQAETVVNRATSTLECAKARASAAIAIGWAKLGDALANEPRELEHKTYFPSSSPTTPVRLEQLADEVPDHVHSPDCAHQWVQLGESCRACRQGTIRNQERCPTPCPDPGPWWVHLPGKPRERG